MSKLLSGKFTIIAAIAAIAIILSVQSTSFAGGATSGFELATKMISNSKKLPAASREAYVSKSLKTAGEKLGKPGITLGELKKLEISAEVYSQVASVIDLQSESVAGSKNLSNTKIANEAVYTGTTLGQRPAAMRPAKPAVVKAEVKNEIVATEKSAITTELAKIEAQVAEIPANPEVKAIQTEIVNANKIIAEDTGVMALGEEACKAETGSFGKLDTVAYKNLSTIFTTKLQTTAKLVKQKFSTKAQRLRCGAQNLANAFYEGAIDVLKYQRGLEALQVTAQVNAMCVRKGGSIANVANKWIAAGKTAPQIEAACAL